MKMGIIGKEVHIKEFTDAQYQIMTSWGLLKWQRKTHELTGLASLELLDKLAGIVILPPGIEERRQHERRIADAVQAQRLAKNPKPLRPPPVDANLYAHQIGAYNAALILFGFADPPEVPERGEGP